MTALLSMVFGIGLRCALWVFYLITCASPLDHFLCADLCPGHVKGPSSLCPKACMHVPEASGTQIKFAVDLECGSVKPVLTVSSWAFFIDHRSFEHFLG
jgi:hypothetical protein